MPADRTRAVCDGRGSLPVLHVVDDGGVNLDEFAQRVGALGGGERDEKEERDEELAGHETSERDRINQLPVVSG